jgi:hypothetical protein
MASVKKAWIKKYGEEEGLRKWENHKKNFGKTKEELIKKHGKDWYNEMIKKKNTFSLEACIVKYGEKLGKVKWEDRLNKKLKTQKENFKNKKWKNGRTLEEYQQRCGIEDGYNRWVKRNKRQSYMASLQRYIDEFGEIDGRKIIAGIKNNSSLSRFIERYGEVGGKLRYDENCKKCAITEDKMIEKYGVEIGKEKYKEWLLAVTQTTSKLFNKGYSKISQKLFWEVYKQLSDELKSKCHFAELNKEYQFFVNHENNYPNKIIMPDFKCGNSIIEFDCEYWHDENLDGQRDIILESKGYKILRINDIEYKTDTNNVIKKCKEFINENA